MKEIIHIDEAYYDVLNNTIDLYNASKISFSNLKSIVYTIALNLSDKLFVHTSEVNKVLG